MPRCWLNLEQNGIQSITFSYDGEGYIVPTDSEESTIVWEEWSPQNLNSEQRTGISHQTIYNKGQTTYWSWSFSGAYNGSSNLKNGEIIVSGLFGNTEYYIKGVLSVYRTTTIYTYTYHQQRTRANSTSNWELSDPYRMQTQTTRGEYYYSDASYTLNFKTKSFKWAKDPIKGGSISEAITAAKWNELGSYLGISQGVNTGDLITAELYNAYAEKLKVSGVTTKTAITAQHFIALQNAINGEQT